MRFASSLAALFRSTSALLAPGLLLALVGGLSAAPAAAQTFSFTAANYSSPVFTSPSGNYRFTSNGRTSSVTLVTGVAQSVLIDNATSRTGNGNSADISTGTATYDFTLGGVTQTLTQGYTYTGGGTLTYQTGDAVLFNVGTSQISVSAGPFSASLPQARAATFLLLPAATAVPEPGEWATMGAAGAGLCGLMIRARRKKAATGATIAA